MKKTLKDLLADKNFNPREYKLSEIIENANYVFSILKSNVQILMSWGFQHPGATLYKEMKALRFSVNGFEHKGLVYVVYNDGADTFEVYLVDAAGKEISSRNDVCFDELIDVIDYKVEKGKLSDQEYSNKIGNTFFFV